MVYEILEIARERHWDLSVHRGRSTCSRRDGVRASRSWACAWRAGRTVLDVPALACRRARSSPSSARTARASRRSCGSSACSRPRRRAAWLPRRRRRPAVAWPCGGRWRASSRTRCSPTRRSRQRRPRPALSRHSAPARRAAVGAWLERFGIAPPRQSPGAHALGRRGAARGAGARPRAGARGPAARRAVLLSRSPDAGGPDRRSRAHPARGADHHRARHPRPRRGHGARRPRRGPDGGRLLQVDGAAQVFRAPARRRSRASSASRPSSIAGWWRARAASRCSTPEGNGSRWPRPARRANGCACACARRT